MMHRSLSSVLVPSNGDAVSLPPSMEGPLVREMTSNRPLLLTVTCQYGRGRVAARVAHFDAPEDKIMLPAWIAQHIGASDGSKIHFTVRRIDEPLASVTFRVPKELACDENPVAALTEALRPYATLTQDVAIPITFRGTTVYITPLDVRLSGGRKTKFKTSPLGCIIDTDLEIALVCEDAGTPSAGAVNVLTEEPSSASLSSSAAATRRTDAPDEDAAMTWGTCAAATEAKSSGSDAMDPVEVSPGVYSVSQGWGLAMVGSLPSERRFTSVFEGSRVHVPKTLRVLPRDGLTFAKIGEAVSDGEKNNGDKMKDEDGEMCGNCHRTLASSMPRHAVEMHRMQCARHTVWCATCNVAVRRAENHSHCGLCGAVDTPHHTMLHTLVSCETCGVEMSPTALAEEHKCPKILSRCMFCDYATTVDAMADHMNACGSRTAECEVCERTMTRARLAAHTCILLD